MEALALVVIVGAILLALGLTAAMVQDTRKAKRRWGK